MTPRLLLLDALNLVYRSFFAVTGLATSAGRPTNAVFGFVKTLGQLERLWQPTHWLVVFDGGIPADRRELCPEYKAQRPPMPDDLRAQLPSVESYLDGARIPRARVEGQEADDVLATAADRAAAEGFEVLAVSSDKDLMQIVTERVARVLPAKPGDREGPAEVLARTGVRPDQVVDWLALTGDQSDNIPGVPGVGPKTAAKWLGQWGDLAGLFRHLDELQPEKLRLALADRREVVARNARLVRLARDLPGLAPTTAWIRRPPDGGRLKAFFEEMEFHSLADKISEPTLF